MLIIRAMENIPDQAIKKGDEFRLYIVDAHHHMGREGDHKNTPPGAYDFYTQLWFELQRKSKIQLEDDELLFEPVRVEAPDYQDRCFSSKSHWNRMNHGWLVDRTIAFPYTDDYFRTDYPSSASFHISNDKIASWTTRAPHSTRLIGFARVDPHDAQNIGKQVPGKELERAITQLGLRGLKLHPLAQLFLDDIESEVTKSLLRKARDLGIPVLFDTRNIRTVQRIKGLIDSIRDNSSKRDRTNGFSVILAHCGMSPGDVRLHDVLNDPLIFADTSSLHGKDVPILFRTAKDRITAYEGYWSQKFLFGTDYSFLSVQALDVILYLLSREFPGTLSDIQMILGGNALQVVQKPMKSQHHSKHIPKRILLKGQTSDIGLTMLDLILASSWELASWDYMIPPSGTWPKVTNLKSGGHNGIYFDSFLATLISEDQNELLQVWVQRHPNDYISCSFLNSSNNISLSTCELASQRVHQKVMKELSISESIVNSQEELISALGAILQG